jgi:hypothetical protein
MDLAAAVTLRDPSVCLGARVKSSGYGLAFPVEAI